MPPKGSFTLPRQNASKCIGAREAYEKFYGWPWSHDDDSLRELAREVPNKNELHNTGYKKTTWLLELMRECDSHTAICAAELTPED